MGAGDNTVMTDVVFWTCLVVLAYTYLGYPATLAAVTRRHSARTTARQTPPVSVVVAAYNEAGCIGEKIDNLLAQDYPGSLLEIVVVSDASTDTTEAIVRQRLAPNVRLLVQPQRGGKNLALNRGVREARGEVLIFTDANAMLAPGALRRLVAPFDDPKVGLVSGQGLYGELGTGTTRVVSNAYVRYEAFIKEREAALGFVAAADGALYGMRAQLYQVLQPTQVHDLVHPIQVALMGLRSRFEAEAFTVEPPSSGSAGEFRRHVRIIAQGFLVFLAQTPALLSRGRVREAWMLCSHRFLRWISSLFLVGALATNVALVGSHPLYAMTLAAQAAFYVLAAGGAVGERLQLRLRLLAVPYFFCVVSAAGISGFVQFVRGRRHAAWASSGGGR